uniref:Disease resistance protein At4g27190 family n=1 Tax=Cajanus cajan TaxID=3821 RepID=A0A151SHS4_CAJCA|nr:Disease resistance protein At4g27190 family [Cajanus cajan]
MGGTAKLKRYTSISLQHCDVTDIIEEFPRKVNCFRLRVFHLDNKDPLLRLPDKIFNEMKELRVLILIGIHFSTLPSSIKSLTKLKMLCLERCKLGQHLYIIGELEKLRVLSLAGSDIDRLPVELRQLAKLQIFDISNCFKLEVAPADVMSSLTCLEELYLRNSPIQWKDGLVNHIGNASLSELKQLNQLTTLDMQIPKITHLPKNLFFDKLDSYRIVIRDFNAYPVWDFKMLEMCESSRYLALQLEKGFNIHYQKGIKLLFGRVENLLLGQLNDVEDIFYELNYEGFPYLKYLSIVNNSKVKSIINSKNQKHLEKAFPKLESLFLYEVNNMEYICHSELTNDSFCKLKSIKLKICGQLKNVFFSMIKHLSALETIEVYECNSLKEVVTLEMQSIEDEINFPELRSLTLQSLSEFIGFYTFGSSTEQVPNRKPDGLFDGKVVVPKLERMELSSIKIQKIWSDQPSTRSYFQNLLHLDVNDCWNLRYLLSLSMSKSLMNLQSLFISECGMMESIFIETEDSMIEIEENIFPKLKSINLKSIKRLKKIWTKFSLHSFSKLDALIIEGCDKLENVFPSYMVGRFPLGLKKLEYLEVWNCGQLKEIVCRGERINESSISFEFPRLITTRFSNLPNLECFYRGTHELCCSALKNLYVELCHKLKLFKMEIANPEIKSVFLPEKVIYSLKSMQIEPREAISLRRYMGIYRMQKLEEFQLSRLVDTEILYFFLHRNPNLRSLLLSNCFFEQLVPSRSLIGESSGVVPKLRSLKLINLPSLKMIDFEEDTLLFQSLECLILKECPCLNTIAPSSVSFTYLTNLEVSNCSKLSYLITPSTAKSLVQLTTMKVIQCELMETIVSWHESDEQITFRQLKEMELVALHKLESFCSSYRCAFAFPLLEKFVVSTCGNMKTFTFSERINTTPMLQQICVRHGKEEKKYWKVEKLEKLEISHCEKFLKIVEQDNAAIEATVEEFSFPHLTSLNLRMLPQLTCFYPGSFSLECPNLNHLEVVFCANLETFQSQQEAQSSTSVNRQPIFSEGKAIFILESLKLDWKNARMLCNGKFLEDMLHKLVELELDFIDVNQVSNLPVELHEKASNLEYLQISQCRASQPEQGEIRMHEHLKTFFFVCKELHKLCVSSCHHLTTLVHSAVSFCNLKQLSVKDCHGLKHLFTSSAARKLVHLEEMYIVQCESMEEILAEEQEETTSGAIKFERLSTIILDSLSSLLCFYSGSSTLLLSTLIRVLIWKCPNMKTFSRGDIHAESFLGIQGSLDTKEKLIFHQDLNSTVEQMFQQQELFKAIDKECFSDYHELGACWDGEVVSQSKWLCNVLILKLDKCTLPYAIPSSILTCLKNLRELEVRDSDKVKGIFEVNDIEILDTDSRLKILTLMGLSELTHVWANNSQGVPFFQNLQQVVVNGCENLKTLFPASLLDCNKVEVIFDMNDTKIMETTSQLQILTLTMLPKLTHVWEKNSPRVLFQSLQQVVVSSCENLQTLFPASLEKNLKELEKLEILSCLKLQNIVEKEEGTATNITEKFVFPHLKMLHLFQLPQLAHFYPQTFTLECPALNNLSVLNCDKLELFQISELQSIESEESSWINTISEKLYELNVLHCDHLTTLVHHTSIVSFSCLKKVSISYCFHLQHLFTSSMAKKLMNLEEITVKYCESMKEIVAKQGDSTLEAIKFEQLNTIILHSLPSLICFYSGSDTLQLLSLIKVHTWQCPRMKYFSQGTIDAKSFLGVQLSLDPNDDLLLNQDLNASIREMFQRQVRTSFESSDEVY